MIRNANWAFGYNKKIMHTLISFAISILLLSQSVFSQQKINPVLLYRELSKPIVVDGDIPVPRNPPILSISYQASKRDMAVVELEVKRVLADFLSSPNVKLYYPEIAKLVPGGRIKVLVPVVAQGGDGRLTLLYGGNANKAYVLVRLELSAGNSPSLMVVAESDLEDMGEILKSSNK